MFPHPQRSTIRLNFSAKHAKFIGSGCYSRAHIVTTMGRTAEVLFTKTVQGLNPFTDAPDWAAPYVNYAADNGFGDGLFDPDSSL